MRYPQQVYWIIHFQIDKSQLYIISKLLTKTYHGKYGINLSRLRLAMFVTYVLKSY